MILLSGGILLPPGHTDTARLRRAAELDSPAAAKHAKLLARGLVTRYTPAPPARIEAWSVLRAEPWAGGTILPRALPGSPVCIDRRSSGTAIDFVGPRSTLRPYQEAAAAACLYAPEQHGVVVAPCGAGKTTIGVHLIARLGRRALVLVHTLDLAEQWRERIADDLDVQAGIVGDGRVEDGQIVIATMQTLATWRWPDLLEWGKGFGVVLVDEAHHAPCASLTSVLGALPALHRFGLTATPDRVDGLTPILHWLCGPVVSRIGHADLAACGAILLPVIRRVETEWEPSDPEASWAASMTEICEDEARNALLDEEVSALLADDRRVLVLSDRVQHCRDIAARHGGEALVGALSPKRRADLIARARAGSLRVVCGTTVADEGLDIPGLDAVVLASPCKAVGRVEQRIGRAMRPEPGKRAPVVVDLVDAWGPLQNMARLRRQAYRRLGAC